MGICFVGRSARPGPLRCRGSQLEDLPTASSHTSRFGPHGLPKFCGSSQAAGNSGLVPVDLNQVLNPNLDLLKTWSNAKSVDYRFEKMLKAAILVAVPW